MEKVKPDKWPAPGDILSPRVAGADRTREWHMRWAPDGCAVISHDAVLSAGEDITEFPETWILTREEWISLHPSLGLTRNGIPVGTHAERAEAWRKLRRMANGEAGYTEQNVREAFGAVRRILVDLAREVSS